MSLQNARPVIVHEFDKNKAERVRLTLEEFRRRKYLDIRIYFDASKNEVPDWRPGRKGVCLPVDCLEELNKGIENAMKEAGLTDDVVDHASGESKGPVK